MLEGGKSNFAIRLVSVNKNSLRNFNKLIYYTEILINTELKLNVTKTIDELNNMILLFLWIFLLLDLASLQSKK